VWLGVVETMLRIQSTLPALLTAPLVVDLEAEPVLTPWLSQHETAACQRLLACFGMLPNFAYRTFLPYVRSLMRPADLLLLSANLSPGLYADAVARIRRNMTIPWRMPGTSDCFTVWGLQPAATARRTPGFRPMGYLADPRCGYDAQLTAHCTMKHSLAASRRKCFSPPAYTPGDARVPRLAHAAVTFLFDSQEKPFIVRAGVT
jgi:hypothetical protein